MRWISCSVAAVVLVLAGCGDDDAETGTAGPPAEVGDDGATGGADGDAGDEGDGTDGGDAGDGGPTGAVDVEALEERCDEFLDLVVTLRGQEPQEVRSASIPPGPQEIIVGDEPGYLGVGCLYLYDGDTMREQHRVMLTVSRPLSERADDPDVRASLWDDVAGSEEIEGLGDAAKFHTLASFDARSVLHVLVGDDVVAVRVATPLELEGAPFLEAAALESAARAFLDRLEL
jgi:hypothetical protein